MKKYYILLAVLFGTTSLYSQTKMTDYQLSAGSYSVFVGENEKTKKEDFMLYIDCRSKDGHAVQLILNDKQIQPFVEMMGALKTRYAEWSRIAENNHVEQVEKETTAKKKFVCRARFKYSKTFYDQKMQLKTIFVVEGGHPRMCLENGLKLKAKGNRWIQADGFEIAFSNETEIESFIKAVDYEKAQIVLKTQRDTKELFK